MKHLKKAEQKCSETAFYRYVVGFAMLFLEVLKSFGISVLRYITELFMCLSLIGIVVAAEAFDNNEIDFTTAMLFIVILGVLIITLVKIKILESRGEK